MDHEWLPIEDFPEYLISNHGFVQNGYGRMVARRVNNLGIAYVGLSKEGRQYTRSVTRLVADAFLPPHPNEYFDTPINLDGDRINNRVWNLMWRPRWFAVKFHRQFSIPRGWNFEVEEIKTEQWFESPLTAAMHYGLLALEVATNAWNTSHHSNTWDEVWPTGNKFRSLDK